MTLVSENTFHSPDLVSLCTVILYAYICTHICVHIYVCLFVYAEALYHEAFSAIPVIKWALVSNQHSSEACEGATVCMFMRDLCLCG